MKTGESLCDLKTEIGSKCPVLYNSGDNFGRRTEVDFYFKNEAKIANSVICKAYMVWSWLSCSQLFKLTRKFPGFACSETLFSHC